MTIFEELEKLQEELAFFKRHSTGESFCWHSTGQGANLMLYGFRPSFVEIPEMFKCAVNAILPLVIEEAIKQAQKKIDELSPKASAELERILTLSQPKVEQ